MLHIMAGVYITCFIISAIASSLHILSIKKHFKSLAYRNLNSHLARLGLFWSDSKSMILPLKDDSIQSDQRDSIHSFSRVALLACFTSLIGCLLLMLFIFSTRFLAKPRLEKKLFLSPLATSSELSREEITQILLLIKAEFNLDSFTLS